MSAQVTARVSGHRVEDLSQRTETTQVVANPDGTWTEQLQSPTAVDGTFAVSVPLTTGATVRVVTLATNAYAVGTSNSLVVSG